ncbi:riboflavin synthase [Legionella sp. WA2024007413]
MFTGIIESKGIVISNTGHDGANRLCISSGLKQLQTGESIAVNGVCLTLLPMGDADLSFDVSPETLQRTTLGRLKIGNEVNLERAMLASTRFGGHYVSGHVDALAHIHSIKHLNEFVEVELSGFDANAMLFLVPKGSITVEGVSLTINSVSNQGVKLMLVPHTLLNTTLSFLEKGQEVNIEFDYLARIVAHQLQVAGALSDQIPL